MHKRTPIIIALTLITVLSLVGIVLWKKQSDQKSKSLTPVSTPTEPPKIEMATWDDPAGFTFQYPKTIIIDKHNEDKTNYAHLEFTNGDQPSVLFVWAKDIAEEDVVSWVKKTKEFINASTLDTVLGGLAAKKIVISEPVKKMIVATVSDQIVFYAELQSVGDTHWQMVFDTIVKSFEFTGDDKQTDTTFDVVVDEEETIE